MSNAECQVYHLDQHVTASFVRLVSGCSAENKRIFNTCVERAKGRALPNSILLHRLGLAHVLTINACAEHSILVTCMELDHLATQVHALSSTISVPVL